MESMRLRFSMSMAVPMRVLIRLTESAPSASTALAMLTMSVTLGESFTMSVLLYALRTARTTLEAPSVVTPKAMPPSCTLGQDMFNSMACMSSRASMHSAQRA